MSGNAEIIFTKHATKSLPAKVILGAGNCFAQRSFLLGAEDDPMTKHLSQQTMMNSDSQGLQGYTDIVEVKQPKQNLIFWDHVSSYIHRSGV